MAKGKTQKKRVEFSLLAPDAQTVALAGDFTGWEQNPVNLAKMKTGRWKTTVALDAGTYRYRFLVNGQWQDDPECTARVANPFGGEDCVKTVE
jgi:1,4-alpha-glucan branching enzyme